MIDHRLLESMRTNPIERATSYARAVVELLAAGEDYEAYREALRLIESLEERFSPERRR